MYSAYLLTGSNEGDRQAQLEKARILLEEKAGTLRACSRIYETESWGKEDLPLHLNQALLLHTGHTPAELLAIIGEIEQALGRVRQQKWGMRSIDIDIIYFEDYIIQTPELCIPHPLMHLRRFVLAPLTEIAPDKVHPVLGKTNKELLTLVTDPLAVTPL